MIHVIAEIAGGHLGEVEKARELINLAAGAGADSIKFQVYLADELCTPDHSDYKLFQSLEFTQDVWAQISKEVHALGMMLFADVFGEISLNYALKFRADGFKIHTADIDNRLLLERVARSGKTILLGIGGRKRVEVYEAVKFCKSFAKTGSIILMPGHQLFPTSISEHSLEEIVWFKKAYADMQIEVGCADHLDGGEPIAQIWPLAAIGAGATYVEKHLTIDRNLKLEDYESALDPSDFSKMVRNIQAIQPSVNSFPRWSEGRENYRNKSIKVPMTRTEQVAGSQLTEQNICYLRPSIPSQPLASSNWLKHILNIDIDVNIPLNGAMVNQRVGILVNARSASTRLPLKALLEIAGKPSILHILERMRFVRKATEIIFCTTDQEDDDELADIVSNNGFNVYRGANDNVALRLLMAAKEYQFDHVVRVTGDDLLRDVPLIDEAIESHLRENADYTMMNNVVYSCESEIISVRALLTIVERAAVDKNTEYLSWYLDDPTAFVQNRLEGPERLKRDYRLTLDTAEDLDLLRHLFSVLYNEGELISLDDVIDYLDKHPEIAAINGKIHPKLSRQDLDLRINI